MGEPARVLAHPRARPEDDRRLRGRERGEEERSELAELLRHKLQELHREPAEGVVPRRRATRQRLRVQLPAEAGDELVVDVDLRPGAEGEDGGGAALRYDRDEHRPGLQPGPAGALEPQVARRDGPVAY